jgi:hypothetical protein
LLLPFKLFDRASAFIHLVKLFFEPLSEEVDACECPVSAVADEACDEAYSTEGAHGRPDDDFLFAVIVADFLVVGDLKLIACHVAVSAFGYGKQKTD